MLLWWLLSKNYYIRHNCWIFLQSENVISCENIDYFQAFIRWPCKQHNALSNKLMKRVVSKMTLWNRVGVIQYSLSTWHETIALRECQKQVHGKISGQITNSQESTHTRPLLVGFCLSNFCSGPATVYVCERKSFKIKTKSTWIHIICDFTVIG